jgi:Rab-like protein 2
MSESKEQDNDEADLKIILLGDSAVGKSKLVERYLMDDFNPRQDSTYALSWYRKNVTLAEENIQAKVDFWDTAGQERFNQMHVSYYQGAHVCILVFDVTRKQTYAQLKEWYRELRAHREFIPCLLVANKIDVDYNVTKKNFKFAEQNGLPFFFVSAADGTNVVKVFEEAIKAGWEYKHTGEKDFIDEVLDVADSLENR